VPRKATPRWASLAEAAAYLGVDVRTLRRRIADGSLPAYRFGPRQIRVDLNDVDAMMRRIPIVGSI
jgi:excisionase family DNA binding protein